MFDLFVSYICGIKALIGMHSESASGFGFKEPNNSFDVFIFFFFSSARFQETVLVTQIETKFH